MRSVLRHGTLEKIEFVPQPTVETTFFDLPISSVFIIQTDRLKGAYSMPQEISTWHLSAGTWDKFGASLYRVFVKQSNSDTGSFQALQRNLQF